MYCKLFRSQIMIPIGFKGFSKSHEIERTTWHRAQHRGATILGSREEDVAHATCGDIQLTPHFTERQRHSTEPVWPASTWTQCSSGALWCAVGVVVPPTVRGDRLGESRRSFWLCVAVTAFRGSEPTAVRLPVKALTQGIASLYSGRSHENRRARHVCNHLKSYYIDIYIC